MDQTFWLCVLVSFVGLTVVAGIVFFGLSIFTLNVKKYWIDNPFFIRLLELWDRDGVRPQVRHFMEAYVDYLERRNEFWTTYGQVLVAVLIIIVLTILLLTKTITAEAGLPILSAISGFAIAKGVTGTRPSASGPDVEKNG
ncbi:hypothetical protein [Desulforhabdus amnigena]|uniref:Uncharacterized protein n=1 Tax=Desulforhabdus amnigena TaxID=40218 RepID=A0A9W6D0X1_9BACT|nr:hypothetical protein [Desulforhabdus amnigena]NLJ27768.1 hypothetical protein [Deltaproteobacteria bacterium]GLI33268.1 hypothetical protein DAMNIGENAA_07010 [Desulforhabdus amnigena]